MRLQRCDKVAVTADIDDARDLLGQQIVHGGANEHVALGIVPGIVVVALVETQIAQNIMIVQRLAYGGDAVDDLRRVEDGQVLRDDADGARVAELQRAGIEIRAVIELVRDLQNTVGRLLLDAGLLFRTLETVAMDTPARSEISRMVAMK